VGDWPDNAGTPAITELIARHTPRLLDALTPSMARGATGAGPLRLTVQSVRSDAPDTVGIAGTLHAGALKPGDEVVVMPGGHLATVAAAAEPDAGAAVAARLEPAIPVSPGDLVGPRAAPPGVAGVLQATLVWAAEQPMLPGRTYWLRRGPTVVMATVAPLKYRLDDHSGQRMAATRLNRGEVGVCGLQLRAPIAFDPFSVNQDTGSFEILDSLTGRPLGAGLIEFALRRSENIRWQSLSVTREARVQVMGQQPCVLWLTGLSGAGKSTIADHIELELHLRGRHTYLLDGDNVRHGLNRDLGFTEADRVENIRRVAEVARLMLDAGLVVLVSFISPFRRERQMARELIGDAAFYEIYVDTPLPIAEQRDPKGLYRKARAGELRNFTGIDSPYEPPEDPEIRLDTTVLSAPQAAAHVLGRLESAGMIDPAGVAATPR
jgi:bifunctional enzyme CysN/CysC